MIIFFRDLIVHVGLYPHSFHVCRMRHLTEAPIQGWYWFVNTAGTLSYLSELTVNERCDNVTSEVPCVVRAKCEDVTEGDKVIKKCVCKKAALDDDKVCSKCSKLVENKRSETLNIWTTFLLNLNQKYKRQCCLTQLVQCTMICRISSAKIKKMLRMKVFEMCKSFSACQKIAIFERFFIVFVIYLHQLSVQ